MRMFHLKNCGLIGYEKRSRKRFLLSCGLLKWKSMEEVRTSISPSLLVVHACSIEKENKRELSSQGTWSTRSYSVFSTSCTKVRLLEAKVLRVSEYSGGGKGEGRLSSKTPPRDHVLGASSAPVAAAAAWVREQEESQGRISLEDSPNGSWWVFLLLASLPEALTLSCFLRARRYMAGSFFSRALASAFT